jgi:hypothetical protein
MIITDTRLKEVQEAYKADFGEEISSEEAREMLFRVVTLYELLVKPVPKKKTEDEPEAKV